MISRSLVVVLALVFVTAFIAEAQVVTDGLLLYWSFDEDHIDGDTAIDVSGNIDGTIYGGPEVVAGKVNEALEFDGEDDYVEAELPDGSFADGATLEQWFFQEGPVGWSIIIKVDSDEDAMEVSIGDGNLEVWSSADSMEAQDPLSDGNWHHVVATAGGGDIIMYVDGENAGEVSGDLDIDGSISLNVGRDPGYNFWPGMIDEVRAYSRALSQGEVEQNMAARGAAAVKPADKLAGTWGNIKVSE